MSANRRAVAAIVALVVLAVVAVILGARMLSGTVGLIRSDGGAAEPDPQFAEPAETVTRPPELIGEAGAPVGDDPSAGWDLGVQTPVDKTAEELSKEMTESGE